MQYALKVNVALSVLLGVLAAGIAALLGGTWWVWGLAWAGATFVALATVQVGSEVGRR